MFIYLFRRCSEPVYSVSMLSWRALAALALSREDRILSDSSCSLCSSARRSMFNPIAAIFVIESRTRFHLFFTASESTHPLGAKGTVVLAQNDSRKCCSDNSGQRNFRSTSGLVSMEIVGAGNRSRPRKNRSMEGRDRPISPAMWRLQ
jgi:hypothetical protein